MASKQVVVMRKDLNMRKGKMIAQGSHSILGVFLDMMNNGIPLYEVTPEIIEGKYTLSLDVEVGSEMDEYLRGRFKKIAVSVNSEEELLEIYQKAMDKGLPVKLIKDAGLTEFGGVPTFTCLAIGPSEEGKIDEVTGHLKLL